MNAEVERTDWLRYLTENFKGRHYRDEPPIGTIRSTYQNTLRCFYQRIELLSGQGKGMLKESFQVFIQELNESELTDEVSKLT
jgi:hypothetical protein